MSDTPEMPETVTIAPCYPFAAPDDYYIVPFGLSTPKGQKYVHEEIAKRAVEAMVIGQEALFAIRDNSDDRNAVEMAEKSAGLIDALIAEMQNISDETVRENVRDA